MIELFQYQFFTNAILAALLTSITCGVIGSYIVIKRVVFISGGITHASFGGVGLGYMLGFNPIVGAAIFGIASGNIIEYLRDRGKVREDSAIAILWAVGMALGILFIYLTPGYAPDLNNYLFGDILTVSNFDLTAMSIIATAIVALFTIFFRLIIFIAFNEEYAKTNNVPIRLFKHIIISLIALTIVINIRVAGIILVMSLLTIPQATAQLFTKKIKEMIILSIIIAFIGSLTGLMLSYIYDIPSGATIILSMATIYIVLSTIKSLYIRLNRYKIRSID